MDFMNFQLYELYNFCNSTTFPLFGKEKTPHPRKSPFGFFLGMRGLGLAGLKGETHLRPGHDGWLRAELGLDGGQASVGQGGGARRAVAVAGGGGQGKIRIIVAGAQMPGCYILLLPGSASGHSHCDLPFPR